LSMKTKNLADDSFKIIVFVFSFSIIAMTLIFFYELWTGSYYTLKEGLSFFTISRFDPVGNVYGVYPEIYGSVVTSAIALLIGVPISLGVAIFLAELSPGPLRSPISFIVELLAAVPSVIYGFWALLILSPLLSYKVYPVILKYLGFLPIFRGPISGATLLTAGVVLAVMIIPIVSAVSKDCLLAVPDSQREAAYALGATRSEAIRISVLSYAKSGILASIFLGLGRAFGETIAVAMVIGNSPYVSGSLFSQGATLASLILNDFGDSFSPQFTSALVEAGLILLCVVFLTNVVARYMIGRLARNREAASYI